MSAVAPGGDAPVTVHCDETNCFRTCTGGATFDAAYKAATADGWRVVGAHATCPSHAVASEGLVDA